MAEIRTNPDFSKRILEEAELFKEGLTVKLSNKKEAMMMKRMFRLILILFSIMLLTQAAVAEEKEKKDYSNEPWERAALYLGGFITDTSGNLKLGVETVGPQVSIDPEDVLGLDDVNVFRADGFWRITRRNRVDFSYYKMKRDASTVLGVAIPGIGPIGSKVETDFDMTVVRGSYAWSFFKNENFDLGISGGLHVMGVDVKMEAVDLGEVQKTKFTAPLPVLGLRGSFALTPKWFIRQSFDYFYIKYGDYKGQLIDFNVALEWNALKYLGLGVGYNYVQLDLDYDGSDNFLSEINLAYGGVLLFGKIYF